MCLCLLSLSARDVCRTGGFQSFTLKNKQTKTKPTTNKKNSLLKQQTFFNFIFTLGHMWCLVLLSVFQTRSDSGWRQSSICAQSTPNLTATPLQLRRLLMFKKLTKNSKNFSSPTRIQCLKTPRWIWKRGSEAPWNHLQVIRISRSWAATAVALVLSSPPGLWELTSISAKVRSLHLSLLPASWKMPPNHPT